MSGLRAKISTMIIAALKWTPLSRQFIIEFKRVLSLLQLTGAVPILLCGVWYSPLSKPITQKIKSFPFSF